jgi:superfamily II DNA or RNA helicase
VLRLDLSLKDLLVENPAVERPDMDPDPLRALTPSPVRTSTTMETYFDQARRRLNLQPLTCQSEAFAALGNYFGAAGKRAAWVMSVGAGKTALGVVTCLAFAQRRAMIVTPGA